MKILPETFDVFILGAGPAGLCAAIRLLDMGYSVGLLEQEVFPRPQIGESLSPGIRNIFDYLNASPILDNSEYLENTGAKVIWESREEIYNRSGQQNGGIIVDRSRLDQELLKFSVSKDLYVIQPGKLLHSKKSEDVWHLEIAHNSEEVTAKAKVVLDARGRKGTLLSDRLSIAPPAVAVWTHIENNSIYNEAFIEAVDNGWLWGSPICGKRYRIMAFTDPAALKTNKDRHLWNLMQKTQLFASLTGKLKNISIETCSVTSFVNQLPWHNQFIKIGEAAFTLDPLSSTGVEKAMRFSLQTAIAVNTFLKDPDSEHPKNFYEEKMIESVVSHADWTADYYRNAWLYNTQSEFWTKRTDFKLDISKNKTDFTSKLEKEFSKKNILIEKKQTASIPVDYVLYSLWNEEVIVSSKIAFKSTYAVDKDCIVIKEAVIHPNLERPLVYLDQIELFSLFKIINGKTVSGVLNHLNHNIPLEKSKKILAFLLTNQLLVVNEKCPKI
ncbi:flavin-dependent monooxygenase QhpG [Flavobacterium gelatinilyticum]|uniref:flavin-dependent monooxygenase QhpG n=1 Tax=Flavobacterium gelatinilyticum TaxID=3003260 RepID=UPI00247FC9D1|nr:tryptophan 7-halogenase [Flavobacterium gelatinilyticum]